MPSPCCDARLRRSPGPNARQGVYACQECGERYDSLDAEPGGGVQQSAETDVELCGEPTNDGSPCQRLAESCPYH